jgi:RimJ/RimL family protein N-acetyltransferase
VDGPVIETEHLLLTPLTPADAEALFAYRSLPEVSRYQSWEPESIEDARAFIDGLAGVAFGTPRTWFQLGLRTRDGGVLIGDVGVHFLEDGDQVEVGFTLSPRAQGRGLATEAVRALMRHLFEGCGTHRVTASVDPRNEASVRLLQRVGMRQEAHLVRSLRFKGEWADDLVFAILGSEWSAEG